MLGHFINQKLTKCGDCDAEIPEGAWAWGDDDENLTLCEDCGNYWLDGEDVRDQEGSL